MTPSPGLARPRSASPYTHSWSSSLDDDFSDGPRATTAGSLGGRRALTPLSGISRPASPAQKFRPESPAPKTRAISVLKDRDKESMVEEVFNLSKRISDQANYIKRQKIYASNLRLQNRRLEKNVDSLEMLGAKGPRTGAPTRLRAILQGLRLKAGSLEAVCDSQEEEILQLQRDLRVTNTRETQIERDVYSGEIGRLQRVVKQLKKSHIRLSTENKELSRMREKIVKLEVANERLELSIKAVQGSVIKAEEDMDASKQLAEYSLKESRDTNELCENIQLRRAQLEKLVEKEKASKEKLEKRMHNLSALITKTEKKLLEFVRKGGILPGLNINLRGGASCDVASSSSSEQNKTIRIGKADRIYGGGLAAPGQNRIIVVGRGHVVDEGCQTSVISSQSYLRDIPEAKQGEQVPRNLGIPKLNLGKLRSPQSPSEPQAAATTSGNAKVEHVAAKARKQPSGVVSPRPDAFSRPPSRLAFVSEAESPKSTENEGQSLAPLWYSATEVVQDDGCSIKHGRSIHRLKGGGRKLEPVMEDAQLHEEEKEQLVEVHHASRKSCKTSTSSSSSLCKNKSHPNQQAGTEHLRHKHEHASSSSYVHKQLHPSTSTSLQPVVEISSRQDYECMEWLKTLDEVPEEEDFGEASGLNPQTEPSYAEDTLQLMHLNRQVFDYHRRPGSNRLIRRHHPP